MLYCVNVACLAQPQWRFHLAFEDGTGARDTIWMIYDTAATTGPNADTQLGEGSVNINESTFQVYTLNILGQPTKTIALPYSFYPFFSGTPIEAVNWQFPVTIRWDPSLFNAPYLPYDQGSIGQAYLGGDYFFFHSNDGSKLGFNMLLTDHVVVEDGFLLFPTGAGWGPGTWLGSDSNGSVKPSMSIGPVPADDRLLIRSVERLEQLLLVDELGRTLLNLNRPDLELELDLSSIPTGAYMLLALTERNHRLAKVIPIAR